MVGQAQAQMKEQKAISKQDSAELVSLVGGVVSRRMRGAHADCTSIHLMLRPNAWPPGWQVRYLLRVSVMQICYMRGLFGDRHFQMRQMPNMGGAWRWMTRRTKVKGRETVLVKITGQGHVMRPPCPTSPAPCRPLTQT